MAQEQDLASGHPPRLFVTGSTGQLGRVVVEKMLERAPSGLIVAVVYSPNPLVAKEFATQAADLALDALSKARFLQKRTFEPVG